MLGGLVVAYGDAGPVLSRRVAEGLGEGGGVGRVGRVRSRFLTARECEHAVLGPRISASDVHCAVPQADRQPVRRADPCTSLPKVERTDDIEAAEYADAGQRQAYGHG